jgi:hypothetical protein
MEFRRLSLLLTLVLLLIAVGCSSKTPTPSVPEPSPVPSLVPTVAPPTPTLLPRDPTPKPELGNVQGLLLLNGQPAGGHVLYLATIIRPESEGMGIAALDPARDPRAESDASGYFVFLDVAPGRYALGIMSPVGPVLINGIDGKEILAEVQAGQVLDLGDVKIVPFVVGP